MQYKIKDLRNFDINFYSFISSGLSFFGYPILAGYDQPYVISGIYLVDGYPDDFNNVKTPSISLEHSTSRDEPLQIGPGMINVRRYSIDVYARTDGERDDLGELVRSFLFAQMPIYDYNLIVTGGDHVQVGLANFQNIIMSPIHNVSYNATKYQMHITCNCLYEINSGYSLVN